MLMRPAGRIVGVRHVGRATRYAGLAALLAGAGSLSPTPLFEAPLTHSLVPTRAAGSATPTFTRATTATVKGYGPTAVSGDNPLLLTVASGEARFRGARRISEGVWSDALSDGTPIPEAQLLGYLAEGARTNLCLQSEDFSTTWTASGGQSVAKDVTGPDGVANSGTTVTWTTTADTRRQQITKTSGATATHSIFLKAGNTSHTALQTNFSGGTGKDAYAFVRWSDNTVTVGGGDAANVTVTIDGPYGNGWYRVTATHVDTGANTSMRIAIFPCTAAAPVVATGTVLCFGGQVEENTFASTYIATTTGSVTRNADILTYPSAGNVVAAEATILLDFTPATSDETTEKTLWSSNLDGNNWIRIASVGDLYLQKFVAGVSTPTFAASYTPVVGVGMKVGARWSPITGMDIFLNGVKGGNQPDTTTPVLGTTMEVGTWFSALSGYCTAKNLRIYNRALSDAQLQGLTS